MKRHSMLSGLMMSSVAVLTACSQQTPARLVSGYGESYGLRPMVERTPTTVPLESRAPDASEMAYAPKALVKEEALADISPAAGPVEHAQKPVVAKPVSVLPVATVAKPVEVEPTMVEHKVVATDTAYKLARKYDTSVSQILKDNNLKAVSDIRAGQVLTIAQNSKPQTSAWDDMKKMLNEGPTDSSTVAERKALAEARMAAAADNGKLALIEPAAGERPKADNAVSFQSHTVEPKETIYRISLKYNVSVLDIMAANEFTEPQDLKADTVIKVPVRKATTQLAAKAAAPLADVAPAAGDMDAAVVQDSKPVQVAMLTTAKEVQREELETKAVQQQAFKDEVLPVTKDKPLAGDEAKMAEQKRGYVDSSAANAKGLVWPVKGQIVRRFGDDGSGVARTGINIAVPKGTSVLASEGGKVLYADDGLKIYGKMVLIRHDNGMVSAYAHNSYLLVRKNERVKKGQVIALSGASGNVESPQLHFELRQHASAVDPVAMLPRL